MGMEIEKTNGQEMLPLKVPWRERINTNVDKNPKNIANNFRGDVLSCLAITETI